VTCQLLHHVHGQRAGQVRAVALPKIVKRALRDTRALPNGLKVAPDVLSLNPVADRRPFAIDEHVELPLGRRAVHFRGKPRRDRRAIRILRSLRGSERDVLDQATELQADFALLAVARDLQCDHLPNLAKERAKLPPLELAGIRAVDLQHDIADL
jgi:hypothetical protein